MLTLMFATVDLLDQLKKAPATSEGQQRQAWQDGRTERGAVELH
jgi:hypothetical protein